MTKNRIGLRLMTFLLLPAAVNGQSSEATDIGGRWFLTAELPTGRFILPVEIIRHGKGQPSVVALRGGVKFSAAELKDQKLTLKGTSTYGPIVITARIEGARMKGEWRAGSDGGQITGERERTDTSVALRLQIFEEAWQAVLREYYDPSYGNLDWRAVRERYLPRARSLPDDAALFALVNQMLSELKSSHVQFTMGTSEESTGAKADAAKVIEWRVLSPHAGYIKIASFQDGPELRGLIDRAFDDLGKLPALLIDLRGNGGGTLGPAMRLGDHLLDSSQPLGFFATRLGLERGGVATIDQLNPANAPVYTAYDVNGFYSMLRESGTAALVAGGRVQPAYRGKVMILINKATASAAEAFVAVMQEQGRAVLIGPRATAGKMLSARNVNLSDGWVLELPEADFRTRKGVRLEGKGVAPDIVVKPASGDRDIPLIEASRLIEHPR
jgi:C-terminal processing protease CtpA/Prc